MENVAAFNNELSGLYDSKPPISKAKMAAITKSAMRAIKFYKHVVQSVEKFILKCKPEYKVPGLYVIDSIVRQSRHQFGAEKDVFAPRFARNIKETFANLFRCAPEDKSRIIRVLNLWQKNNVFAPEVIQPIFDLADPNHPIYQMPPAAVSSGSGPPGLADMSATANGLNTSGVSMDMSMGGAGGSGHGGVVDDKIMGLPDLSNNNLKQLLNDPNVLRQLQTLQNFQKFRQQEDKQHKLNEMRMQEEAFEKHLQNVLKGSAPGANDSADMSKEVEFISEEQKIEVINLDGNDSRSPSPDRDRYKRRRSRSRSRSRDRGGGGGGRDRDRRRRTRSRSRSRSPRSNRRRSSRDRDRNDRSNRDKDKEKDREHERERRKKGLPDLKKEHLSVCSTTLWVGHLSKLVYQEELSDTFGEYGDIVSIDQIVPRGCAFIVMNRRQDAHKAMQSLKNHKLQGRAITISWAAGKGVKSKEWKDFWDLELGVTYIPWNKLDDTTDLDSLEEGGMFDEDSMPAWMKDKINQMKSIKEKGGDVNANAIANANLKTNANTNTNTNPNTNATVAVPPPNLLFGIDTTQPPPGPPGPPNGPPPMMSIVPGQFSMAPPMGAPPRPMLGPMGVPLSGIPMPPNMVPGMPPSHPMMMGGMMPPPGFPPIPGGAGQMDKNRSGRDGGGPLAPPLGAFMPMGHMGLPPGATQFPPPPTSGPGVQPASSGNVSTDDQMDIEMDEDDGLQQPPAIDFNLPPPLFPGGGNVSAVGGATGGGDGGDRAPDFVRERRGGPGGSRWGGRGGAEEEATDSGQTRWHENGGGNNAVGKFGGNGGPQNFGEVRGRSGPMNIPPLDLNNPPQRPEFMDEFENRGRGPPARSGNQNGEFFPNMQNRFNQPTSLLQMRIPPPNSFNSRMGGPPMFMRGQGGAGGPTGGRQQGPGGFFNERQQFDRDGGRGAGGGGRGGRGGGRGGRGGTNNWRDERDEEDDGIFKRRNAGGPGGNRFRDRDGPEDRHSRDRERGGRRGANERTPRDRNDRERRDSDRDRGNRQGGNRRNSRDDRNAENSSSAPDRKPTRDKADTEDDWDRELAEYDAKNSNNVRNTLQEQQNPPTSIPENNQNENINEKSDKQQSIITETHERDANHKDSPTQNVDDKKKGAPPSASALVAESTPLYDELPPPNAAAMPPKSVSPHQAVEKSEPLVLQAPPLQASPSEAASVMAEAFKPPTDTPAEAESTKGHDTSEIVGGDAGASAAEQTN